MNSGQSETVVNDTGIAPRWVRLLTLPFGVLVSYLWIRDAFSRLSGRGPFGAWQVHFLLGYAAMALLLVLFAGVWVWRSWIIYERASSSVILRHRGLLGTSNRSIPSTALTCVSIRKSYGRATAHWNLFLHLNEVQRPNRRLPISRFYDRASAVGVGMRLSELLHVPFEPDDPE